MNETKAQIQQEYNALAKMEAFLTLASMEASALSIALEKDEIQEKLLSLWQAVNFEREVMGNAMALSHGEDDAPGQG